MAKMRASSKRAQGYIWATARAIHNGMYGLYKAYKNPSLAKVRAYESILYECEVYGSSNHVYIIGHNCMQFTTAHFDKNDLIINTACNEYRIVDGVTELRKQLSDLEYCEA